MLAYPTQTTLVPADLLNALRPTYPKFTERDISHPVRWTIFVAAWQSKRCQALREANDVPAFARFIVAQNRNKRSALHRLGRMVSRIGVAPRMEDDDAVPASIPAAEPSTPAFDVQAGVTSAPMSEVAVVTPEESAERDAQASTPRGRDRWETFKAYREIVQLLDSALRSAQDSTVHIEPEILARVQALLAAATPAPRAARAGRA